MSAIFGVICFGEGGGPSADLKAMLPTMETWGPDGVSFLLEENAGLGHAHRMDLPESCHETMPFKDLESGLCFTAAARLDNRRELCGILGISTNRMETLTDSRLVCMAYLVWGEEAPVRLRGDWAFAVWDDRRKRLFMARDTLGVTGLYYSHTPPYLYFSTSPKALLAVPDIAKKPDEHHLAHFLACPEKTPNLDRTFWASIRRLPPGVRLVATRYGVVSEVYYHPENMPVFRYSSHTDYLERFLELFQRAVTVRLRSLRKIGTQLSAGLDSGSVTALAARQLKGSGGTLAAFTSVPATGYRSQSKHILTNEWGLARHVCDAHGNIIHVPISAEHLAPLDAVRRYLSFIGHPVHGAGNLFWMMATLEAARDKGIGVMLTGQAGNAGVSWAGGQNRIFLLFCEGRWKEGWNALEQLRRRKAITLREAVFTHLMIPALRRTARTIHVLSGGDFRCLIAESTMREGFARRTGLEKTLICEHRVKAMRTQRIDVLRRIAAAGSFYQHLGAMYGLDVRDPTADQELVEFCLGVPESLYTAGGLSRTLIRDAMNGILPESVRLNERRGRQAADLAARLAAHAHDMDRELDDLENQSGPATVIDIFKVRRLWGAIKTNPGDPVHRLSSARLLRSVMAGRFMAEYH